MIAKLIFIFAVLAAAMARPQYYSTGYNYGGYAADYPGYYGYSGYSSPLSYGTYSSYGAYPYNYGYGYY